MNWLAHLYLSESTPQFRVGNLLPDLAPASQLRALPDVYQDGIRRHRQIDIFTDTHPRWKSCVSRFPSPYRRYGGILTDVYFDHFLARDWHKYSSVPLRSFIADFYLELEICLPEIPAYAAAALDRMREQDWLGSYDRIGGIRGILQRISHRLRRPFDLAASLPIFEEHQSAFHDDFHAFFPELMRHVDMGQPRETELQRSRFQGFGLRPDPKPETLYGTMELVILTLLKPLKMRAFTPWRCSSGG
jgi:acyl carrier protein phosphodiesterase